MPNCEYCNHAVPEHRWELHRDLHRRAERINRIEAEPHATDLCNICGNRHTGTCVYEQRTCFICGFEGSARVMDTHMTMHAREQSREWQGAMETAREAMNPAPFDLNSLAQNSELSDEDIAELRRVIDQNIRDYPNVQDVPLPSGLPELREELRERNYEAFYNQTFLIRPETYTTNQTNVPHGPDSQFDAEQAAHQANQSPALDLTSTMYRYQVRGQEINKGPVTVNGKKLHKQEEPKDNPEFNKKLSIRSPRKDKL